VSEFFGVPLAERLRDEGHAPRLIVANNVLAHVPDINDFVTGIERLLAPGGIVSVEFPHLLRLIEGNQFDTIYHEHFSYLTLAVVDRVMEAHALRVVDVEELSTHGGSLRVSARHLADPAAIVGPRVEHLLAVEREAGLDRLDGYGSFGPTVEATKRALLGFLIEARADGRRVVGYGAPGKGNTLLNYCGIRTDLVEFLVDRNPYKHGRFTPGTHIPIAPPDRLRESRPDLVLVLPWNLRTELVEQLAYVGEWGGRLVFPIPTVEVVEP
jgi:hypothetical protein